MIDVLQLVLTVGNVISFICTALGRYRTGFLLSALMQPGWFYLGCVTDAWANSVLGVFYLVGSIWGIIRENRERQHCYGDFTEAVLWFFKIGWEPCDNHGVYWNPRLKKTRGINNL